MYNKQKIGVISENDDHLFQPLCLATAASDVVAYASRSRMCRRGRQGSDLGLARVASSGCRQHRDLGLSVTGLRDKRGRDRRFRGFEFTGFGQGWLNYDLVAGCCGGMSEIGLIPICASNTG